jgi:hypothetical protein
MQAHTTKMLESPAAPESAFVRQRWDARAWTSFGLATGFGVAVMAFVAFALSHH